VPESSSGSIGEAPRHEYDGYCHACKAVVKVLAHRWWIGSAPRPAVCCECGRDDVKVGLSKFERELLERIHELERLTWSLATDFVMLKYADVWKRLAELDEHGIGA